MEREELRVEQEDQEGGKEEELEMIHLAQVHRLTKIVLLK